MSGARGQASRSAAGGGGFKRQMLVNCPVYEKADRYFYGGRGQAVVKPPGQDGCGCGLEVFSSEAPSCE